MSKALMPRRFTSLTTLDVESINANLRAGSNDIGRNQAKIYTYSEGIFQLSGVSSADPAVQREFAVRRFGSTSGLEITAIEVAFDTSTGAGVIWTITCSDPTFPAFTITVPTSGAAYASSGGNVSIPSSTADVTFSLSASGASTITTGYFVVHFRNSRGNQSTGALVPYVPGLLTSATPTGGSTLTDQLNALAAAVTSDATCDLDVRCELFRVRALVGGSSLVWRLPSGARRKMGAHYYSIAAGGVTTTFDVDGVSDAVPGTGASTRTFTRRTLSGTLSDDPMNPAEDTIVTISSAGGTTALAYAMLFWS